MWICCHHAPLHRHAPHLSDSTDRIAYRRREGMAVRNSFLEGFSSKFRSCRKIICGFFSSTKCYPCQGLGTFQRQGAFSLRPSQPSRVFLIYPIALHFLRIPPYRATPPKFPYHKIMLGRRGVSQLKLEGIALQGPIAEIASPVALS